MCCTIIILCTITQATAAPLYVCTETVEQYNDVLGVYVQWNCIFHWTYVNNIIIFGIVATVALDVYGVVCCVKRERRRRRVLCVECVSQQHINTLLFSKCLLLRQQKCCVVASVKAI